MTASLGAELLAAAATTRARAAAIVTPVLLMHGKLDTLCPVAATTEFAAQLTAAGSALRIYPELRHEVFNEPEREQVYADAWRWIQETMA
jgi:alpha-beta hydrolase superfamily lysophospholipase